MRKELLFWCPFFGNVGTINATLESSIALSQSDKFNCKIINVFGELDNHSSFLKKNRIKEIRLIKNRFILRLPKKGFFWSRLNFILIFIFGLLPLFFYLKKNDKDILFVYLLSSLPFFVISFFKLKNKIIFRISGKIKYSFFRKKIWSLAKKNVYKILVQTVFSKKKLIKEKIFNKKKIHFLEDPIIDLKKINLLKKKPIEKFLLKKKFFVAVGRLTRQKNFLFLVEFLSNTLKNKNYNLLILGDGEEKQKISSMIKKKKIEDCVFLLGYKKNIFKYIDKSEGLICTSLWEEPGFIIQEAAACKKIILTSNCKSGPAEFLENGLNGFVFKSNNFKSLRENFYKMIKDKKKHKKMVNNNFKKINKYSKKYFTKKIIEELEFMR